MKDKLIIFIYDKNKDKFLLLSTSKYVDFKSQLRLHIPSIDTDNSRYTKEDVIKKIKDKTGLILVEIFSLNWGSTYKINGEEFKEMNFMGFIDSSKLKSKQNYSEFCWVDIDELVKITGEYDDKALLKKVLTEGINKRVYFDKQERGE